MYNPADKDIFAARYENTNDGSRITIHLIIQHSNNHDQIWEEVTKWANNLILDDGPYLLQGIEYIGIGLIVRRD